MPNLHPSPASRVATSIAAKDALQAEGATQTAAGPSYEVLQLQLTGHSQQLAVLTGQVRVLENQLNLMGPGAARDRLVAQKEVLDNQLLKARMDVAGTKAQIASRLGVPVERVGPTGLPILQTTPDFFPRRGPDPDMVVGVSFALAVAVGFPLAIAYARRIWRGKPVATTQADTMAPRLDRLEQAVEAIAIEIERVAEGQRFVTKVLAERPVSVRAQAPAEAPVERDAASALGEAKPFLALGAGPMEPIRVAERQAVRQSITPH
jgi:hypothetical protein